MPQASPKSITRRTAFAGASVLLPTLALALAAADPVYAAIEAHRSAHATHHAAYRAEIALEETLPADRCRSSLYDGEIGIVDSDDPRYIEALRAYASTAAAMFDAAEALALIKPVTMAGIIAVMRYVADAEVADEYLFAMDFDFAEGGQKKRALPWSTIHRRSLLTALEQFTGA
jgi:hypothetical protein